MWGPCGESTQGPHPLCPRPHKGFLHTENYSGRWAVFWKSAERYVRVVRTVQAVVQDYRNDMMFITIPE